MGVVTGIIIVITVPAFKKGKFQNFLRELNLVNKVMFVGLVRVLFFINFLSVLRKIHLFLKKETFFFQE
jgi:type IV secretory pathway TrbL component